MIDSKKIINRWALYDWANSVYSLVISSTVFPLFWGAIFKVANQESVTIGTLVISKESLISYVTALSFLTVALLTPLLSGVADYLGNKKFFLKLFCTTGALSCCMLYFFSFDAIWIGLIFYFLALVGFCGSLVYYNAYLPEIAPPEQQDAVSAKGFSFGYVGSVLLLIICLALILSVPDSEKIQMMRSTFVLVGLWWLIFGHYSIAALPNLKANEQWKHSLWQEGFLELQKVYFQLQKTTVLKSYLWAFFVYSMAVQTIMLVAAYFGEKEIAWQNDSAKTTGLIVSILLIQLIAIMGAFFTSKVSNKIGNIKTLMVLVALWILICAYAYQIKLPTEFYTAASLVGLVMGGIQSLSRSTFSKLLPETTDTASFFGFFDIAEKLGIVIGMFSYGFIADITGKMQNAILFMGIVFFAGFLLLLKTLRLQQKQLA